MTATGTRPVTADELLRLSANGFRGELVRGELRETMSTGIEHGKIVMKLGLRLGTFIEPRRLGTLVGSDSGFWLERDPDTVREPDIAFVSADRMPMDRRIKGFGEGAPDLVVEIVSPTDTVDEVSRKALMWQDHGARLVWVLHPDHRTVDVYRPGQPVQTLTSEDSLDGHDVLPGFRCDIGSIFDL